MRLMTIELWTFDFTGSVGVDTRMYVHMALTVNLLANAQYVHVHSSLNQIGHVSKNLDIYEKVKTNITHMLSNGNTNV